MTCKFVRPIVPNKSVKILDPCLNRSRQILPEVVGGGIFGSFFADFRPEVGNYVISDVAVDYVVEKVGDSK